MAYCGKHGTNHCVECAISSQTEIIVAALARIERALVKPEPWYRRLFTKKMPAPENPE